MKFSTVSFVAICGATAVSARPGTCKKHHAPLKLENFGNFTMLPLDDAKAGIVKSHNGTTAKISDYPSAGYPTAASTYSMKPAYYSAHSEASASQYSASQYSATASSSAPGYSASGKASSSGYAPSQAASATESSSTAAKTTLTYKAPTSTAASVSQSSASVSQSSASVSQSAASVSQSAASVSQSAASVSQSSAAVSQSSASASQSSASASSASESSASASAILSSSTASSTGSASISITSSSLTASSTLSVSVTSSSSSAPAASSSAASTCEERTEWRSYSNEDRHKFSAAFKCLLTAPASGQFSGAKNRYEDIVRVHQMMTSTIHGNNVFLLWHRYYVWTLQQIMKEECGFDGAFPWWDETLDSGNFAGSSIFTAEFFGSLPGPTGNSGTCITDGYFANTVSHIGPGTSNSDHCLSRAVNEDLTKYCTEEYVETCNQRTTYATMENCAEMGPHAYGHNGVGSVMSDVSASPSDPTFFLHHLFIDRNFWLWQNGSPSTKAARNSNIDGCLDNNTGSTPCEALTLDTVISVQGLRPDVTVKDILNTQDGTMCYTYSY